MNLNRYLKQTAKNVISTSRPKVLFAGLIYLVFVFIVSELSGRLLGLNVTAASLEQYFNYIYENNIEYALTLAQRMMPGAAAECIMLLLRFSQQIVFTGLIIFLMNSVRGTGASFGNLLDGFGYIIKLFFLSLVQTIFIALWSLLLVVPGIIAAYRYSMATYILLDNPEMSVMQCLKTSKQMMQGHKAELFRCGGNGSGAVESAFENAGQKLCRGTWGGKGMTAEQLLQFAKQARENAYTPYSGFRVGAALLCKDGKVFTGCNLENGATDIMPPRRQSARARMRNRAARSRPLCRRRQSQPRLDR